MPPGHAWPRWAWPQPMSTGCRAWPARPGRAPHRQRPTGPRPPRCWNWPSATGPAAPSARRCSASGTTPTRRPMPAARARRRRWPTAPRRAGSPSATWRRPPCAGRHRLRWWVWPWRRRCWQWPKARARSRWCWASMVTRPASTPAPCAPCWRRPMPRRWWPRPTPSTCSSAAPKAGWRPTACSWPGCARASTATRPCPASKQAACGPWCCAARWVRSSRRWWCLTRRCMACSRPRRCCG